MLKLIFYVKTHGAAQVMVAAASVSPRKASDVSRVVCPPALATPVSPRHPDGVLPALVLVEALGDVLQHLLLNVGVLGVVFWCQQIIDRKKGVNFCLLRC